MKWFLVAIIVCSQNLHVAIIVLWRSIGEVAPIHQASHQLVGIIEHLHWQFVCRVQTPSTWRHSLYQ